jgi:mono/diheme cytochrome c family protein
VNHSLRTWILSLLAVCVAVPVLAQSDGAKIYKSRCVLCHGEDGLGATAVGQALKVPSLKSPNMRKLSEAQMIAVTKNGKGRMPAWKASLSDAQIRAVVTYIRTLQK